MPSNLEAATKKTVPAVSNLGRLIARMALDEALHREYLNDPAPVIEAAGLSDKEEEALTSENWPAILRLLGPDDRGGSDGRGQKDPNDG